MLICLLIRLIHLHLHSLSRNVSQRLRSKLSACSLSVRSLHHMPSGGCKSHFVYYEMFLRYVVYCDLSDSQTTIKFITQKCLFSCF